MRADQLTRLEALRDRLVEVAIVDADPASWCGAGKKPRDMTKEERGDAKWCRNIAISTVALTMQVQRLMQNPLAGGASVPDTPTPAATPQPAEEDDGIESEIARYEAAAAAVLKRHRGKKP